MNEKQSYKQGLTPGQKRIAIGRKEEVEIRSFPSIPFVKLL